MSITNPFLQLDDNIIVTIFNFLGPGHYRYIVANKHLQHCYLEAFPGQKEVHAKNALASIPCANIASQEASQWWINGRLAGYCDSLGRWQPCVQNPEASICPMAARYGKLEILQWCRARNFPWQEIHVRDPWFDTRFPEGWQSYVWRDHTCEAAARNGHLNILIWARRNHCPWDERTCAAAALGGHLHVLTWAQENGCPWDALTCRAAAFAGNLELLQYAVQHHCECDWTTCECASKYGHFQLLRWASTHGCPWQKHNTCRHAAVHGNLAMMEYALANNCPFDMVVYLRAAQHGHVNILQWGLQRGDDIFDPNRFPDRCKVAAARGHLSVLQFARKHGQDMSENFYPNICSAAARHGQLNILMWVRNNNLLWDSDICAQATSGGHLQVLQWLTEQGCPWNSNMSLVATQAACLSYPRSPAGTRLAVLEWVLQKTHPEDKRLWADKCLDHCIAFGKEDVLAVLLREYDGNVALNSAQYQTKILHD
jgi:hypothetical protein